MFPVAIPMTMTPDRLRLIADWLDLLDKMAARFVDLLDAAGYVVDAAAVRTIVGGHDVQDDLRTWAKSMELAASL